MTQACPPRFKLPIEVRDLFGIQQKLSEVKPVNASNLEQSRNYGGRKGLLNMPDTRNGD